MILLTEHYRHNNIQKLFKSPTKYVFIFKNMFFVEKVNSLSFYSISYHVYTICGSCNPSAISFRLNIRVSPVLNSHLLVNITTTWCNFACSHGTTTNCNGSPRSMAAWRCCMCLRTTSGAPTSSSITSERTTPSFPFI